MKWATFFNIMKDCADMTPEEIGAHIEMLEEFGCGKELVDVLLHFPGRELRKQLAWKAIQHDVHLTPEDFRALKDVDISIRNDFDELAIHCGYDPWEPWIKEENLSWEDFEDGYTCWTEIDTLRRIEKLNKLGPKNEVLSVMWLMRRTCAKAMYQKAISLGMRFSKHDLQRLGLLELVGGKYEEDTDENMLVDSINAATDSVNALCNEIETIEADLCEAIDELEAAVEELDNAVTRYNRRAKKRGFFGALVSGVLGAALGKEYRPKKSRYCDGDCANCPAHYGYRYGRWYYGHGHMHGCERRGNGGARGKTLRN